MYINGLHPTRYYILHVMNKYSEHVGHSLSAKSAVCLICANLERKGTYL